MLKEERVIKIFTALCLLLTTMNTEVTYAKDCESAYYKDMDGDGFVSDNGHGEPVVGRQCKPIDNFYSMKDLIIKRQVAEEEVLSELDCDDTDKDINKLIRWYEDQDGDGYSSQHYFLGCSPPSEKYKQLESFIAFEVEDKKEEHEGLAYRDCDDSDTKVIHNYMPIDLSWQAEGFRLNK